MACWRVVCHCFEQDLDHAAQPRRRIASQKAVITSSRIRSTHTSGAARGRPDVAAGPFLRKSCSWRPDNFISDFAAVRAQLVRHQHIVRESVFLEQIAHQSSRLRPCRAVAAPAGQALASISLSTARQSQNCVPAIITAISSRCHLATPLPQGAWKGRFAHSVIEETRWTRHAAGHSSRPQGSCLRPQSL
jgi:hypothetical protein